MHNELGTDRQNTQLQREELDLQEELGIWLANEENQWRQKSREPWMHLGDRNTKFFYSVVKARQNRYTIYHLIYEDENLSLICLPSKIWLHLIMKISSIKCLTSMYSQR